MKRVILPVLLLFLAVLMALPAHASNLEELEEKIIDACVHGDEEVDVSGYGLTGDQLRELVYSMYSQGKLPWYVQKSCRYRYDQNTGLAVQFLPKYLEEEQFDRGLYEQRISEILDAAVHEGMDQWQMALSLHDYLVARVAYDESRVRKTGYELIIDGTAVCAGYAAVYQDLLLRVGIPCVTVDSEPMDHRWNMVYLNGGWYHVDATWDDPITDVQGRVRHEYFLVNDEQMLAEGEEGHYGWETDLVSDGTYFQDAFWRNVDSQICYLDGDTSLLLREEEYVHYISSRDETAGEETVLYTVEKEYIPIGGEKWAYGYYGLSLWNGRLYFSSLDTVYSMDPDGSDVQQHFSYDTEGNDKYIAGIFVEQDTVYLTLRDMDGNESPLELQLEPSGYHVHSYTKTVIEPGCEEPGKTVYTCDCGITCEVSPTRATGHAYVMTVDREASFLETGLRTYHCAGCNDTYSETSPKLDFFEWLTEEPVRLFLGAAVVLILLPKAVKRRKK